MSESIVKTIHALREMSVGQLRIEWERLYGAPTRSRNRDYLWRRLAWRVQELSHGGLPDTAKARMLDVTPAAFVRSCVPPGFLPKPGKSSTPSGLSAGHRDPRLPAPGSSLVRKYRGQDIRVLVLDDAFEWGGRRFGSLSEVAHAVTRSRWNGWLFFGLTERKRGR